MYCLAVCFRLNMIFREPFKERWKKENKDSTITLRKYHGTMITKVFEVSIKLCQTRMNVMRLKRLRSTSRLFKTGESIFQSLKDIRPL